MDSMEAIVKQSPNQNDFALTEVPIPEISGNELLVRVKAIGVGIQDSYFFPQNMQYPYPIGMEAAGIIEKTGQNVTAFQEGDQIAFVSMMQPKGGTWAEYAVLGGDSLIVPIPEEMSFTEAAAVPIAGNTTLKAFRALQLNPDDSLFIAGATGAIGTFAIQLAVAQDCIVAGSASEKNHEYMLSLGADKAVDYHDADWTDQISQWRPDGVDAAVATQPDTAETSMEVVKDGGTVIAVSGDQFRPERNISVGGIPQNVDVTDELVQLMNEIASDEIKLFIEKTYAFENGLAALRKVSARHNRGKNVIKIS